MILPMKYKIEKNTVQETLIIPLYARKDVYKRQVRGLILTVSHKEQIGELYPQVLEALVYGACRELFK